MRTAILARSSFHQLSSVRSLLVAASVALLTIPASAQGPRVLSPGQLPDDVRLQPLKDLDGYFPFQPPASKEAWAQRADEVRRQILVSQGLWPMPPKTPLNPVIHGRTDTGEYTVEKVYFESHPGFFVTGNLYRPKNVTGKAPAVLFAHGHWKDARLSFAGEDELRKEIATGQERFEQGGRSRFQSMCVQLARMGCVVWQWDMLGDSDAQQLSRELVHRHAKQRPEMNTPVNWGFYSAPAEARLQSVMGLQTWNAIRSLDFVLTLPEVDPARIAITGASGGGTQTMLLAAVDDRVALSYPAVMVSTAMQGGCTCENASLLRVNTGNVEFAALFAPKPQGMTTANDWTKEMATKGFPDLQQLYKLMGRPDHVMLHRGEHFPHNYNAVSRAGFHTWLNRHFKLGFKEPVLERDYEPLPVEKLTVWDEQHPKPPAGDDFERKLVRYLTETSDQQVAAARRSPEEYRRVVGGGFEAAIGRTLATAGKTAFAAHVKSDRGSHVETAGLLHNTTHGEALPVVFLHPKDWQGRTVIWVDGQGKAALFGADLQPRAEVRTLLQAGVSVVGADLLYQGEFLADGQPLERTGKVKNPREFAGYTFGYNYTVFAKRVHDVLTILAHVQTNERESKAIDLLGVNGAGPVAAAARALSGGAIRRAAIDTGGFRFSRLLDFHDPNFLPGGAKYDDLPGLLALNAPGALRVAGEADEGLALVRAVYATAGEAKAVEAGDATAGAAIAWLLK
jgi:dienelactone hydrolase